MIAAILKRPQEPLDVTLSPRGLPSSEFGRFTDPAGNPVAANTLILDRPYLYTGPADARATQKPRDRRTVTLTETVVTLVRRETNPVRGWTAIVESPLCNRAFIPAPPHRGTSIDEPDYEDQVRARDEFLDMDRAHRHTWEPT
jgi:hypothetical protein